MSAEEQEKEENKNIVKNAEARLKSIQELLKKYEDLNEKQIQETLDSLQNDLDQMLENNLEKFNYKIGVELDLGEAKR